jgi:hypothetical protein
LTTLTAAGAGTGSGTEGGAGLATGTGVGACVVSTLEGAGTAGVAAAGGVGRGIAAVEGVVVVLGVGGLAAGWAFIGAGLVPGPTLMILGWPGCDFVTGALATP